MLFAGSKWSLVVPGVMAAYRGRPSVCSAALWKLVVVTSSVCLMSTASVMLSNLITFKRNVGFLWVQKHDLGDSKMSFMYERVWLGLFVALRWTGSPSRVYPTNALHLLGRLQYPMTLYRT